MRYIKAGTGCLSFEGTINSVGVYQDVISDDELVQLTGQTTYADNIFYAGDATKSNYFRIPSLLTLDSGTVIAAADARYGGTHDSKAKSIQHLQKVQMVEIHGVNQHYL